MDAIPPVSSGGPEDLVAGSPSALLDFLIPGFSIYATAVSKYLHIDLNLYIPLVLLFGGLIFVWRYFSEYFSGVIESHLMSVVDIRPDDEIYNMLMAWVANQRFARSARRFVVNTNVNSRSWMLWRSFEDDEEDEEEEGEDHDYHNRRRKKRALAYTPTFGSHWFLYKNRILIFKRTQNSGQNSFLTASEREEISISCFGRNPWVLKELLHEAREVHMKRDEAKTLIYRGTTRSGSTEPVWQRSMARTSRPFSTVILNEKVKKDLIDDVTDYLNPATQRWYSNRGIPYRRGYLLHGPPGTGKSSLSLALAGFFKMRIYIVSLSSVTANEENLATLFAELPRRCVVLLEDIDTAGLTHTRDNAGQDDSNDNDNDNDNDENTTTKTRSSRVPGQNATNNNNNSGRLSLSGLLNILDGVSSQEGRVLIMTTNHIEKLDKALIRPGRVDMIVKFDRADTEMTAAIFRAIYAPLEGDDAPSPSAKSAPSSSAGTIFQFTRHSDDSPTKSIQLTDEEEKARAAEAAEAARKKEETIARVDVLAAQFAAKIPAHEFSPAEIQGYLLKNKRDPERTVAGAEEWVAETRKAKKEKELKEAEEKREREEKERKEKEEEEKKKKKEEEEEKKKKEEGEEKKRKKKGKKEKEKRKGAKKSKKKAAESESSGSESSSEEESESEAEKETSKKRSKAAAAVAPVEEKAAAPEIKVEPASMPTITVDTDKAKEAAVEQQKTPQGADSGYGTP